MLCQDRHRMQVCLGSVKGCMTTRISALQLQSAQILGLSVLQYSLVQYGSVGRMQSTFCTHLIMFMLAATAESTSAL